MDRKRLLDLAYEAPIARLATITPEGLPHLVPITFTVVDRSLYTAVDFKPKRTSKLQRLKNIESTAGAEVLMDGYSDNWEELWWVRLSGPGRIVKGGPEWNRATKSLVAKYPQYARRPSFGPVIALDIASISTWSYT